MFCRFLEFLPSFAILSQTFLWTIKTRNKKFQLKLRQGIRLSTFHKRIVLRIYRLFDSVLWVTTSFCTQLPCTWAYAYALSIPYQSAVKNVKCRNCNKHMLWFCFHKLAMRWIDVNRFAGNCLLFFIFIVCHTISKKKPSAINDSNTSRKCFLRFCVIGNRRNVNCRFEVCLHRRIAIGRLVN